MANPAKRSDNVTREQCMREASRIVFSHCARLTFGREPCGDCRVCFAAMALIEEADHA